MTCAGVQIQGVKLFQQMTPPVLDRVVKKCLEKEVEKRWQTPADLCDELKWIAQGGSQVSSIPTAPAKGARALGRRALILSFGMLLLGAAIGGIAIWSLKPFSTQRAVSRTAITLPAGQRLAGLDQPALAMSPDGTNIVYVAVQRGTQQLFLRPVDSLEAKPIAGTEGAVCPFFSPDGQWIGFFAGEKLKKVSVNGGAAVSLTVAPRSEGASWSSQGILAFQANPGSMFGVQQISQEGGMPKPLTRAGKRDTNHAWPEFLPGGNALFFATSLTFGDWTNAQIAVQTGTGDRKDLGQAGTQPRYASTGHLLYARSGTPMAAPFDALRLAQTGAAVPVLEGLMQSTSTGAAQYSLSSTGTLVYLAGDVGGSQSRMVWVSRNGEEQPLPAVPHNYLFPRVSPDGQRVAVTIAEPGPQIWVYSIARDTFTRLTFEGDLNSTATWSPDGRRIAFGSNRERQGLANLFWQLADGSSGAERLTTSDYLHAPGSFSPDGHLLAFVEVTPETRRDIWVLNLADHKAQPFLRTPYEETAPKFSPDGRWLAYSSDETGQREIYVQPYPGPGGKWQISTEGGQEPVWNPNGHEVFYRSGSKIMTAEVDTKFGFSGGKPKMLFDGPYLPTGSSFPYYDVSPNGQRFLMLKPSEPSQAPTQINVVLNWFEELKQKVPTGRK